MAAGRKTGGRQAGTPNKATAQVKEFLGRVFARAFDEKVQIAVKVAGPEGLVDELREVSFEDVLVREIQTLTIDTKLLVRLLEYHAGAPAKQIEHSGKLTLEQIVAGSAADEGDELEPAA